MRSRVTLAITEAAAMAAGRWVGRGDKNAADGAAVNAMRSIISTVQTSGTVVIGEGEKDDAPMLYNGELVGDGTGPECDVAVDPVDGTRLTAQGMGGAIAVLAVADRGAMCSASASSDSRIPSRLPTTLSARAWCGERSQGASDSRQRRRWARAARIRSSPRAAGSDTREW